MISALLIVTAFVPVAPVIVVDTPREPPVLHNNAPRETLLSADEWARPRSGERVLELAPVRDIVNTLLASEDDVLVVSYPGGDAGALWATELRDWLVALGLPRQRIELRPGALRDDLVVLRLEQR
jgi:hypothetical protein